MTEVEVLFLQHETPSHQQPVVHGDHLSEQQFINHVQRTGNALHVLPMIDDSRKNAQNLVLQT